MTPRKRRTSERPLSSPFEDFLSQRRHSSAPPWSPHYPSRARDTSSEETPTPQQVTPRNRSPVSPPIGHGFGHDVESFKGKKRLLSSEGAPVLLPPNFLFHIIKETNDPSVNALPPVLRCLQAAPRSIYYLQYRRPFLSLHHSCFPRSL